MTDILGSVGSGLTARLVEVAFVLALAAAAVAVVRRPVTALYIFIVGLPLHNFLMALLFQLTGSVTFVKLAQPWKEVLLALALARLAIPAAQAWQRDRRLRLTLLDVVAVAFGALCVASTLLPAHAVAAGATPISFTGRLYGLRQMIEPLAVYAVGRLAGLDRRTIQTVVALLGLDVIVLALGAFGERILWGNGLFVALNYGAYLQTFFGATSGLPANMPFTFYSGSPDWLPRTGSFAMNPLDLSTLLMVALPLLLVAYSVLTGERGSRWLRLELLAALALGGGALLLADGRTSLVMTPLLLIAALAVSGGRRAWAGLAAGGGGALAGLGVFSLVLSFVTAQPDGGSKVAAGNEGLILLYHQFPHFPATVAPPTSSFGGGGTSLNGHLSSLKDLLGLLQHRPIGYGIGTAGAVGVRFGSGVGAESSYLNVGVGLGVLGLALFLGVLLGAAYVCFQGWRARGDRLTRLALFGVGLAWVATLADGVVAEVTINLFVMFLLFWLAGSAETFRRASRAVPADEAHPELRGYLAPRPLRVAVDAQCLQTARTGVRTYFDALMREFQAPGVPHVVVPLAGPRRLPGTNRVNRIVNQALYFAWLHGILPAQLSLGNFDVLFSPDYLTPIYVPTARVVTYHDAVFLREPENYNPQWLWAFRHLTLPAIRRADAVIAPSRHAAGEIAALAGIRLVLMHVTPLAASAIDAPPEDAFAAATLARFGVTPGAYILHVGVLEKRKNLVTLIDAFHRWRQQGGPAQFHLVLVGPEPPSPGLNAAPAIRRAIADRGLEAAVVFTGHLTLAERNVFYAQAAIVAVPSRLEGFGIPVLEGFAAGVPVVAARASSLPEVADQAALLFEPDDAQALAECFAQLAASAELRRMLAARGDERLRDFTWQRTAAQTLAVFEEAAVHYATGQSQAMPVSPDNGVTMKRVAARI